MSGFFATVATVAGVILALPFILAVAGFALHAVFNPGDAQGNAERGGEVIATGVENELPAWTDPVGLALAFALATILVGLGFLGVWAWNNAE